LPAVRQAIVDLIDRHHKHAHTAEDESVKPDASLLAQASTALQVNLVPLSETIGPSLA
jgi:hypothetical protein